MSAATQGGRKFQFLQEIASGGFGSVYLAKMLAPDDPGGPRIVAVKLLHRRWTDNEEISSRMRDEARLLSRLRHESIVEVLDFAVIDGRAAVIMEYLDAVDARTIVDHLRATGTRLPPAAVFEITAAVASALDAAYNRPSLGSGRALRVIHRDIKPSNLMVDPDGRVKVLDFGIARADFDAREAKTAELAFGSLEYMPPERLFFEPESAASDVYSLGAASFELLAADRLGKAKLRPSEHDQYLVERMREVVQRYAGGLESTVAGEMVELLRSMLSFDEVQRPTASEVASRMRVLAGWCGAPTLEEWSAREVPRLLDAHRTQRQGGGTLVGQVLTEGPVIGAPREAEIEGPTEVAIGFGDPDVPMFGGDDSSTVRDDTRWAELKQQALGDPLEPRGPITGRVGGMGGLSMADLSLPNRPQNPLEWLGDEDDEVEGAPTVRMAADDRWRLLGSDELRAPSTMAEEMPSDIATLVVPPPPLPQGYPPDPGSTPIVVVAPDEGSTATMAYAITALMLFATSALILLSVLMVGGVGVVALTMPRSDGPAPEAVVVEPPLVEPRDPPPAPPPGTAAPVDGVTFQSDMTDTRRIMARCDGVSGVGTDRVVLSGAGRPGAPLFMECTVTAVDTERKRRTAVLSAVEARSYTCFVGEDSTCQ